MAPKNPQTQQQQQQQRKQPAQRRSWLSAAATLAKRVVDPFGLFTSAPAPRRGTAAAEAGPEAAGAQAGAVVQQVAAPTAAEAAQAEEWRGPATDATAAVAADADVAADNDDVGASGGGGGGFEDTSEDLAADGDVDMSTTTADVTEGGGGGYEGGDTAATDTVRRAARSRPRPRLGRHEPLGGGRRVGGSSAKDTSYPMDIYENDLSYELQADVPGMRETDLTVEVSDQHRLVVEGSAVEVAASAVRPLNPVERAVAEAMAPPGCKPRALRTERRRRRHFKRTFRLPHDVDQSSVTASIQYGVLIVRIDKLRARAGDAAAAAVAAAAVPGGAERRRVPVDRLPTAAIVPRVFADTAAAAVTAAAVRVDSADASPPAAAAPPPPLLPSQKDLVSVPAPPLPPAQPGTAPIVPSPAFQAGGSPLGQPMQSSYSTYSAAAGGLGPGGGMAKAPPPPPATPRQAQL